MPRHQTAVVSRVPLPSTPRRRRRASRALLVTVALAISSRAGAQAELQGHVFAEGDRRPLTNAEVAVPRLNLRTLSDSLGRYRLQSIPRGEHLVVTRAVGFRPDSALTVFDGDEALINDVRLKVQLNTLPTVAVREASTPVVRGKMAAYEERKAAGIGHFIDRELLAKDENRKLGDILAIQRSGAQRSIAAASSKSWAASGRTTRAARNAQCAGVSKTEMLDRLRHRRRRATRVLPRRISRRSAGLQLVGARRRRCSTSNSIEPTRDSGDRGVHGARHRFRRSTTRRRAAAASC